MKRLSFMLLLASTILASGLAAQTLPLQISGIVRDTNGLPAPAGLEVAVYPTRGLNSTKTDTNGHYQIILTPLDTTVAYIPIVIVRDPGRNLTAMLDIGAGTDVYDLQLAPGYIISGRVEDEQGDPATNATLELHMGRGPFGWSLNGPPPTIDAEGRFEISALPTGQAFSVAASAKGYGIASVDAVASRITRVDVPVLKLRRADKKIAGVVLSPEGTPVPGARVLVLGRVQPRASLVTDQEGRFASGVCEGSITLNIWSSPTALANATVQSGDTNITITLGEDDNFVRINPRPASLVGKPVPNLTAAGIPSEILQTNKPLLICLFDPEQRSSLRVLRLLAERKDLKDKNFQIVSIPAALMTADSLKAWKQSNPQPFPVGGVTDKNDTTKWILSAEKVPWLIATDPQGRIKAEGFELDDLDKILK